MKIDSGSMGKGMAFDNKREKKTINVEINRKKTVQCVCIPELCIDGYLRIYMSKVHRTTQKRLHRPKTWPVKFSLLSLPRSYVNASVPDSANWLKINYKMRLSQWNYIICAAAHTKFRQQKYIYSTERKNEQKELTGMSVRPKSESVICWNLWILIVGEWVHWSWILLTTHNCCFWSGSTFSE